MKLKYVTTELRFADEVTDRMAFATVRVMPDAQRPESITETRFFDLRFRITALPAHATASQADVRALEIAQAMIQEGAAALLLGQMS